MKKTITILVITGAIVAAFSAASFASPKTDANGRPMPPIIGADEVRSSGPGPLRGPNDIWPPVGAK